MARMKKTTSHFDEAKTRLASLKSISPVLDLGNGLTVAGYEAAITDLLTRVNDYNTALSQLDSQLNSVRESDKALRDLSERMLTGVASRFGKNSDEYEKAGGIRKSERRRPVRRKVVTPTTMV